jgi:uncharacterized membrane protein
MEYEEKFSPTEAVSYGWETFKNNIGILLTAVGSLVVLIILITLPSATLSIIEKKMHIPELIIILFVFIRIILQVISFYFTTALMIGIYKTLLKIYDNEEVTYGDLFRYFTKIGLIIKLIIAEFLFGAMVVIGFFCLVFPGIYIALMFSQYRFCIIEHELGPIEGLKRGKMLTDAPGVKMNLFIFALLLLGVNIAGLIICCIGLLATIPISWLAAIYVYRKLSPKETIAASISPGSGAAL